MFCSLLLTRFAGKSAVEYILNHAECKVAFCSKEKVQLVLDACKKVQGVKFIVQFDPDIRYHNLSDTVDHAQVKAAQELGVNLIGLHDLRKMVALSSSSPSFLPFAFFPSVL